jgi:hypothetical protein
MKALQEELLQVTVGEPRHFRNLTVFPLLRAEACGEPDYILGDHALSHGLARITEVNLGGSVPELRLENNAALPLLLLDGEELIGAKQNRVLNLTVLAPAKSTTVIPVSCVEAGRWNMQSPGFAMSDHVMYSRGRAARVGHVTESLRTVGSRRSDQAAVWEDIAAKAERMAAPSSTCAMSAIFERHGNSVEEYVRALPADPGASGVLFAIGGQPSGVDLFDRADTMFHLFPKLLRSYALDALECAQERQEPAAPAEARRFLSELAAAPAVMEPAVGLGKDLRLTGKGQSGAALWANGRYIHLCGFVAAQSNGGAPQARMSRPGSRRRT